MVKRGNQSSSVRGLVFDLPGATAAAHELKTPLALIRQLSQYIGDEDLSQDEIVEIASKIKLTSERALRLTNDLTKAQRLEDAFFELEPVDLNGICDDVVNDLKPLYQQYDLDLQFQKKIWHLPPVVANRDLLHRIISNLADNALHYSDRKAPVLISTKISRDKDTVRLNIRDFGPSIPTSVWRSIRLAKNYPQAISMRPESSGLGLYLAKQFSDHMNSKLGVIRHSDGASFYIDIKVSKQLSLL